MVSKGALGKKFFKKYQKPLLWFINTKLGKYFFRIHKDVPKYKKIVELRPNSYTWYEGRRDNGEHIFSTDTRTHNKFTKRLYSGFKPIWHLLHILDMKIINQLIPSWNLGFDTLTVYPDDDPETNTVDGVVKRFQTSDTWANLRSGAGTHVDDTSSTTPSSCSPFQLSFAITHGSVGSPDDWFALARFITLFDTSSLPDDTTVINATYNLSCQLSTDTCLQEGEDELCVTECDPASNTSLSTSDYNIENWTDTKLSNEIDKDSLSAEYTQWTLNSDGLNAISKTGVTKLGLRFVADIDNYEPVEQTDGGCTSLVIRTADYTGTGSDPKLVITYGTAFDATRMFSMFD